MERKKSDLKPKVVGHNFMRKLKRRRRTQNIGKNRYGNGLHDGDQMLTKWFFDSNCISDWLINKLALEEKTSFDEAVKHLENLKEIRPESLYAFLCIDTIHYNDKISDFEFFTSTLAISEVISVIRGKYVLDELLRKSIPLKYWPTVDNKLKLSDSILSKIAIEIVKFPMLFTTKGKIRWQNDLILQHTIELITKRKCETYDAYLLSQSLYPPGKCDYFVTNDETLKRIANGYSQIKIVKPTHLYYQLKKVSDIKLNFKNF